MNSSYIIGAVIILSMMFIFWNWHAWRWLRVNGSTENMAGADAPGTSSASGASGASGASALPHGKNMWAADDTSFVRCDEHAGNLMPGKCVVLAGKGQAICGEHQNCVGILKTQMPKLDKGVIGNRSLSMVDVDILISKEPVLSLNGADYYAVQKNS